jgi:diaminohydroxyphosphoribosylaminopyrimidine deaminase/5-amino-6-(5-phosphoribosylamino)uracil reductase
VNWISNSLSQMLVHKWRAEEQAIMIGTNTVLTDNPKLTVRHWEGKNPVRIILDNDLRIPDSAEIVDNSSATKIFNRKKSGKRGTTEWVKMESKENNLRPILEYLYNLEIQSLLIEGGKELLEYFIAENLWDEARIFIGEKKFEQGVKAPSISGKTAHDETILSDRLLIYSNRI